MKLISKIVGVTLGLAMAVGVGAGVAANNGKATMLDASAGDTFERITNASDISDGDVIIIVNQDKNKAMSTTQNNNNRGYVAVTSTDDVITIPNNSTIQELVVYEGEAADEFGFYTGSGFLYAVNNNNYLRTTSDNTPASSDVTGTNAWTISASDGVFSIVNTTAAKNSDHYYIAWNGTNSIFSGYVSGQQKPYVYKKTGTATIDTIQVNSVDVSGITNNSVISDAEYGDTRNLTATVSYQDGEGYQDGDGTVTWSSDDEDVATVSDTGVVTFAGNGEVTITATSTEDDTKSGSVTFTLENIVVPVFAVYTVASTSSVNESGTIPDGSESSYSQTYGTAKQATSGNSMTLSITGLEKRVTIDKLVLSMHSNSGQGAGSISVKADSESPTFIAGTSSSSGSNFNTFGDNDRFGNDYRDVTWDNLNIVADASIEIKIYCISTNSLYCESYTIFFSEEEITDVVTALSVSPDSWSGFDSDTIDVSDYTVSVTKNGAAGTSADYEFQGIGSGSGDTFVARVADFSSGHPALEDTRLQWKAKYPTEAHGSTYLYAYVSLDVSEDGVSLITISGNMDKTSYATGSSWDTTGLTVSAKYASNNIVDVTSSASFNFYSDSSMANEDEVETPSELGIGENKSLYIKATFGGVSNAEAYAQTVTVSKASRVAFIAGTDIGATTESISKNGITISTAAEEGTFVRDDNYRIYSGKEVTISSLSDNIVKIEVTGTTAGYNTLTASGYEKDGKYGTWTGNASSVTFTADGGQTRATEIIVTIASALNDIESTLTTRSTLSYHYTGNEGDGFEFSEVNIRFGCLMSKALWDSLNSESIIQGYGVLVANSSAVAEGKKVKDYYASANGTTIQDFYMPKASKATPSLATSKQKGDLVGDYYIWNRVHTISSEDLKTVYVAAAYIKVNDDIVFLKEVRFSAKTIAGDYIQNRGYAEDTAEYSLRALANLE